MRNIRESGSQRLDGPTVSDDYMLARLGSADDTFL